jgi:hypothetical protein
VLLLHDVHKCRGSDCDRALLSPSETASLSSISRLNQSQKPRGTAKYFLNATAESDRIAQIVWGAAEGTECRIRRAVLGWLQARFETMPAGAHAGSGAIILSVL